MVTTLLVAGLFLIIPASTVAERIEGRWILGPFIFVSCALLTWITANSDNSKPWIQRAIPGLITLTLISPSIVYRSDYRSFTLMRDQVVNVLTTLDSETSKMKTWGLVIVQPDSTIPVAWQFAYGATTKQLKSPPQFVEFVSSEALCPGAKTQYKCVSVYLQDLQINPRVVIRLAQ
jgi:hypothetical protein